MTKKYKRRKKYILSLGVLSIIGLFLFICFKDLDDTSVAEGKLGNVCPYQGTWYEQTRVITHALGGIEGKTYTNSLDALQSNYQHGRRVFEADFTTTLDGEVVLHHDWNETVNNLIDYPDGYVPSLTEFKENYIFYKYQPTTALDLLAYMGDHRDVYLVSDIKYNNISEVGEVMQKIIKLAEENNYEQVLNRFIVQFYSEENYEQLKAIYPFKNWMYALNAEKNKEFDSVVEFCKRNSIDIVQIPNKWVEDETSLQIFKDSGIKVLVFTVNNLSKAYDLIDSGVYGIYSDYLSDADLYWREFYNLLTETNRIHTKISEYLVLNEG